MRSPPDSQMGKWIAKSHKLAQDFVYEDAILKSAGNAAGLRLAKVLE